MNDSPKAPYLEATRSAPAAEAREHLSDLLNRAAYGKERIVLTRRGKPTAAIVPLDDLVLLEAIADRLDLEAARKALAAFRAGGEEAIPLDTVLAELGMER